MLLEDVISDKVVLEIVKSEHGIDQLDQQDIFMNNQNLLHLATEYSKECLDVLLSGDIKTVSRKYLRSLDDLKKTPLHLAASNATSECVIAFINEEVYDVDVQDINGNTPLHLAGQGMEKTMYVLLVTSRNHQKKIDAQNNKGRTPIFYAKTQKMVLLLHKFSDLSVVDFNDDTIMQRYLKINEDCANILLSTGITTGNTGGVCRGVYF